MAYPTEVLRAFSLYIDRTKPFRVSPDYSYFIQAR